MKKYTRKGLIRFYEKLTPRSRPCIAYCPIATYLGTSSYDVLAFDLPLAIKIDRACAFDWASLTAAQIVKIAKAAPHV